jgi:RNA polymerase sigma-70 factor (ECF subfamily)
LGPLHDLTTVELVARARGGCRDSFGHLADRHAKGVYNFLLRRTRSHEDAEELCQESFLRAWRKLDTYKPDWRFSTWVYAIARSTAADRARAATVRTVEADLAVQAGPDDPAREIGAREENENLWQTARAVLGADQHTALWLYYAEERSMSEIGLILGRTPLAVRVLLFRARAALGRHLERRASRQREPHGTLTPTRMETIP